MKIVLNGDWDSLPSGLAKPSQYFSGRKKELARLEHIIANKSSGSILLGAPRGVGKTDLVYKSISDVLSNKKDRIFIPVILNATQLHQAKNPDELPQIIITNLITRTYSACKDVLPSDLFKNMAKLYYQATSQQYEEKTTLSDNKEENTKAVKTYENISFLKITFNKKDLESIIKQTTPIASIFIALLFNLMKSFPLWATLLIDFMLIVFSILSQAIDFSKEVSNSVKSSKQKTQDENIVKKAEVIYLRDNSFGNLENGLKKVLQDIQSTKKYKVFFVIDELDKIKKTPAEILEMIQSFKDLFNHADTLFIFIGDSLLFDEANKSRDQRKTNVYSTLFTERIYITRPTIADIKEYMTKIVSKYSTKEDLSKFIDYIIFKSRMDFFRLIDNIRDCEDDYEGEKPVLNWIETSVDLQMVNKQRVISALIEEGNYLYTELSKRSKNESLIETMYDIAEKTIPFELAKIPTSPDPEQKTILQLELDTANHLVRNGIFTKEQLVKQTIEYFVYTPTTSVGKSIAKLNEPLEYEKEFIDRFKLLEDFVLRIYNFRVDILKLTPETTVNESVVKEVSRISGFSQDLYKSQSKVYKDLVEDPAKHEISQETIKAYLSEIDKHCEEIVRNNALLIIKNVLEEKKLAIWDLIQNKELLDATPSLRDYIIGNSIVNIALKNTKKGKDYILILLLNPPDTIANNSSVFEELRMSKNIYVLELYSERDIPNISKDKGNKFDAISIKDFNLTSKIMRSWLTNYVKIKN